MIGVCCELCRYYESGFMCICPESEYYHNCRLRMDVCPQWEAKSDEIPGR